jgi:glycosyltransferase involved in cell wall biosynthesis
MRPALRLTVVLPFFDEEALLAGLPALLDGVRRALSGHEVRLLAIDDGSRDGTRAGLEAIPGLEVVVHERNRGPGAAMTTGLRAATGDAALVYDPDAAYPPEDLARLVDALADADVATLSPYHPAGGVRGVSALRLLLSRGASRLYRWRLGRPLHTFTCAVRAYRLPQALSLLPAPDDYTAAAYLMAAAVRKGLRIAEVPAVLVARSRGTSKMRLLRTIRAHLRLLRDLSVTPKGSDRPA